MSGVTPYRTIEEIASRLDSMDSYAAVNEALDKVEYLFEVIPPELQGPADCREQHDGEHHGKARFAVAACSIARQFVDVLLVQDRI